MPSTLRRAISEITPYRTPVLVASVPAAVWAVWASGPGWSTPALVVLAVASTALFAIDASTHRLPDAIVGPTAAAVAVLLTVAALADSAFDALLRAALGGLALGAAYLALHLVNPAGLGFGDVKLAGVLGAVGAWYGWPVLWGVALVPFLVGGLVAVALLVSRRASRTTAIAFGPYMLVGAALALTGARLGLLA
ncbi:prepilin peptidase [Oerskovia sp. Sa1BUA8]|uniref:Prepilin peptidase n=1 Tax=Oerskovia douganii TaxID=2762210 RepID=A0A9D5UEB0_9CELL|nr:A24 family peptidase [Oerskovia douganii]MBE7699027.1 prepilin peptidase [Oerskovia douganii]